jgi:hypothetical protein
MNDKTVGEVPCSTHPDAPHGFDRTASHSLDRYVCDCEGWVAGLLASAALIIGIIALATGIKERLLRTGQLNDRDQARLERYASVQPCLREFFK